MEVNIEKIMDDIRTEIKEKGYTSNMLSFKDVTGKFTASGESLSESELKEALDTADSLAIVPFDRPITGNRIAVFIKKLIRKLIRFYIRPTVEQQNEFNNCIYTVTDTLSEKVIALEKQLDAATKANEELRQRIDRLEQVLAGNGKDQ